MNEYELATLSIREWGLWAAFGQLAATVAIGLGQIAVVGFGIRAMHQDSERRFMEHTKRHEERMLALRTLVQQSDASIRQLDASTTALRTLIERTGRPADAS